MIGLLTIDQFEIIACWLLQLHVNCMEIWSSGLLWSGLMASILIDGNTLESNKNKIIIIIIQFFYSLFGELSFWRKSVLPSFGELGFYSFSSDGDLRRGERSEVLLSLLLFMLIIFTVFIFLIVLSTDGLDQTEWIRCIWGCDLLGFYSIFI